MKVLKEKSREYKGHVYYKYKVNIPEVKLVAAKLRAGDELEIETMPGKIILKKKNKQSD